MSGKVVENQGVTLVQARTKDVLQVSREDLGINRAFHQKRGFNALVAQSGQKGGSLPVAVGDGTGATLPSGAAPVEAGHFGVQPGFVDKHQSAHIPVGLLPAPASPGRSDLRPILLGGARRFFYSSVPVAPNDATRPSGRWPPAIAPGTVFATRAGSDPAARQSNGARSGHAFPGGSADSRRFVWVRTGRCESALSKTVPRSCDCDLGPGSAYFR
jgi:hypothetical protein